MIDYNYDFENFSNPTSTYKKISNKIKLGHLIFNQLNKKIEKVNLEILQEIIENEDEKSKEQKYFLLNLTDKWLLQIFEFQSTYLNPQSMTVFTSKKHGLRIHKVRNTYTLAYNIKTKIDIGIYKGTWDFKPKIITVNELLDHLYLIMRDEFDFTQEDIKYINTNFSGDFN